MTSSTEEKEQVSWSISATVRDDPLHDVIMPIKSSFSPEDLVAFLWTRGILVRWMIPIPDIKEYRDAQ